MKQYQDVFWLMTLLALTTSIDAASPISEVRLEKSAFNPSKQEQVRLQYTLVANANVTVSVVDADGGLVRRLTQGAARKAGDITEPWDGRDEDKRVVPDEAYSFTIETDSRETYDPTTSSGGAVGDITKAKFDRESGTVVYELPAPSRVLIRLGIRSGPMHRTLVDWKPRIQGSITEYWDGFDEGKVIHVQEHKDFNALITYVTLPDATVITYGNSEETYRDYKLGRGQDRPKRKNAAEAQARVPMKGLVPPAWAQAPKVTLSFPKSTNSPVPEVAGAVDVRVDVAESDKDELLKGQFEVMFYIDNVFYAEAERGYVPYNWKWELQQLPLGEHILTVNISSFAGQVGAASRKVKVVKDAAKKP
jgi:hypothetical protein